jgi:acetolactate synthase-1/2/3 large subunit
MTELTVAQCVARALPRHSVEIIFGQSLPSAVILACEAIGIRQLAYRQENMGEASVPIVALDQEVERGQFES